MTDEVRELLDKLEKTDGAPLIWFNKKLYEYPKEIERLYKSLEEQRHFYLKELERLKEEVKKWQDIATRINNENNKLNCIIKQAIELLNYVGWTHYADDEEYLYTLDINFYNKMLKILKGEE